MRLWPIMICALLLSSCQLLPVGGSSGPAIQGSGKLTTETRAISSFTAVEFASFGTLMIEQGSEESLTIAAEDNILPLLTSEVNDNILIIGINGAANTTRGIQYRLTVKALDAITISGAGGIIIERFVAERLRVLLSGAGSLDISGSVGEQEIEVAGAGSYNAPNLESRQARVTINGLGNAVIRVSQSLDATITGAGSVEYYGSPTVAQNVSGIGQVRQVQP